MSKEENVLFCKIAVHNKLVDLEDANACLREANQEEIDVAEIFVEEELLSEDQARQISTAVKRKLNNGAKTTKPAKKRPGKSIPKSENRAPRSGVRKRPVKKVNQTQLAVSISSMVVVVIVIVIVAFFWVSQNEDDNGTTDTSTESSEDTSNKKSPDLKAIGTNLPSLDTGNAGKDGLPSTLPESDYSEDEARNKFYAALGDANKSLVDEKYQSGIKSLESAINTYGKVAPKDIMEKAEKMKAKLEKLLKEKVE